MLTIIVDNVVIPVDITHVMDARGFGEWVATGPTFKSRGDTIDEAVRHLALAETRAKRRLPPEPSPKIVPAAALDVPASDVPKSLPVT